MSSKKEEERNEKIIRGLMKLPPNRRCINCDSLGPQYVCTNFWTFICISCSGIHREFTHRVKSVSMAKFTSQEVEALQKGGNQRARELFLRDWDVQRTRLPDSSKPEKIREFIKNVYVDKKFGGSRSSDKPPRDTQNLKDHEDHRRASSYHSFSQSPPYEHQYEDRRYGKPTGMLSRKPGSDRGHSEGKVSSFMLSPGHLGEQMYEDKFANESYGSRISDYSVSSKSDPFRSDAQSPNFQDAGYSSPPLQQVRDMLIEDARPQTMNTNSEENIKRGFDGIPRPKSAASSESIRSSNGNPATNLGSLLDIVLEPEHAFGAQKGRSSIDPFGLLTAQQPTTSSSPSIDLFANVNHHVSSTIPDQKSSAVPFSEDVGWATFDLPYHVASASKTNNGPPSMHPFAEGPPEGNIGANSSVPNSLQWSPVQNSATPVPFPLMADQWPVGLHEVKGSADPTNSQSWNAFDDFAGTVSHPSIVSLPQTSEAEILGAAFGDPYISSKVPEVSVENKFQELAVDDNTLGLSLPFDGVSGSSFPSSVLPLTGGSTREQKSINPFDLPYDSYSEANNVFLDMSSLQEAQLPTTFLGGLSQPWLNPITTFIPSMHQGQVPSSPPQGSVASLGGNPFA